MYVALRLKLGPSRAAELYRSKPLVLQSTYLRRLPVSVYQGFYTDIDVEDREYVFVS
jgi:hypothetical protein